MIKRFEGNPYVHEAPEGQYMEYADHVAQLHAVEKLWRLRYERMLERAQTAERQVINAARALGYVDER